MKVNLSITGAVPESFIQIPPDWKDRNMKRTITNPYFKRVGKSKKKKK